MIKYPPMFICRGCERVMLDNDRVHDGDISSVGLCSNCAGHTGSHDEGPDTESSIADDYCDREDADGRKR